MTEHTPTPPPTNSTNPPPSPPPPRGPSLLLIAVVLVIALASLLAGAAANERLKAAARGLRSLFREKPAPAGHDHEAGAAAAAYYTCAMHPWVILPRPGDCPICGMKLTPLEASRLTGQVVIDPAVTQKIGVRVAAAVSGPVTRQVRTVGTVAYDETRVKDVVVRADGQVVRLYANYEGKPVEKGTVLAEFDSPAQRAAAYEVLSSRGAAAAMHDEGLMAASRDKLRILGVADDDIDRVLKTRAVPASFPIRAPIGGIVYTMGGHEGHWLKEGEHLAELADLSRVWVMATVYEFQLPFVRVGQTATISLPYLPGQEFEGKVAYIYPYLNEEARQTRVRVELDNAAGVLKPGMYANVSLWSTVAQEQTLVPHEAVIDTGERKVVIVSLGEGRFEPRDVRTGVESEGGMIQVLGGVKPGEKVVTSGQFLLDSESRLREALAKMISGNLLTEQKPAATSRPALPAAVARGVADVLSAYFTIGDGLASDTAAGLTEPARKIAAAVDAMVKVELPGDPHFWHKHAEAATVRGKALELIDEKDLPGARQKFADLSVALSALAKATGAPPSLGKEVVELRCPMFREGQGGAYWLQAAGEVRNPYFGKTMSGCFDRRETLPAAAGESEKGSTATPPAPETTPEEGGRP